MAQAEAEVYVARESGSATYKGEEAVFVKGVTRVRRGHWLLKRVAYAFEPVDEGIHYDVEQATSSPGERRRIAVRRSAPKASKAPKAPKLVSVEEPDDEPKTPQAPGGLTLASLSGSSEE